MHDALEEGRGEEADIIEKYVSKGLTKIDAETETGSSTAICLLSSQTRSNVMASRLPLSETVPLFLWLRRASLRFGDASGRFNTLKLLHLIS